MNWTNPEKYFLKFGFQIPTFYGKMFPRTVKYGPKYYQFGDLFKRKLVELYSWLPKTGVEGLQVFNIMYNVALIQLQKDIAKRSFETLYYKMVLPAKHMGSCARSFGFGLAPLSFRTYLKKRTRRILSLREYQPLIGNWHAVMSNDIVSWSLMNDLPQEYFLNIFKARNQAIKHEVFRETSPPREKSVGIETGRLFNSFVAKTQFTAAMRPNYFSHKLFSQSKSDMVIRSWFKHMFTFQAEKQPHERGRNTLDLLNLHARGFRLVVYRKGKWAEKLTAENYKRKIKRFEEKAKKFMKKKSIPEAEKLIVGRARQRYLPLTKEQFKDRALSMLKQEELNKRVRIGTQKVFPYLAQYAIKTLQPVKSDWLTRISGGDYERLKFQNIEDVKLRKELETMWKSWVDNLKKIEFI